MLVATKFFIYVQWTVKDDRFQYMSGVQKDGVQAPKYGLHRLKVQYSTVLIIIMFPGARLPTRRAGGRTLTHKKVRLPPAGPGPNLALELDRLALELDRFAYSNIYNFWTVYTLKTKKRL